MPYHHTNPKKKHPPQPMKKGGHLLPNRGPQRGRIHRRGGSLGGNAPINKRRR